MVSATSLTGAAGEHFVMSELLRRGMIAALAPAGVPNCDIVVTDEIGARLCAVQVKTRLGKGSDGGWLMSKKHKGLTSPSVTGEQPFTYVVPAAIAATCLAQNHQRWLALPGACGQPHKDNDMRRFLPDYAHLGPGHYDLGWLDQYREAWHLLQDATD